MLDPDHIPFPEFLDRVLGHFEDERRRLRAGRAGVLQPARGRSRRAGAAEQTYAFYGPGQRDVRHGAAWRSVRTARFGAPRSTSIGGHGIGLAEDLVTSIRLHARGMASVYVPEVVSRGPRARGPRLVSIKQQLKWSRGVYEVRSRSAARFSRSPDAGDSGSSYLTIGTYYLFGVTTLLFLLFPVPVSVDGRAAGGDAVCRDFISVAAPVGIDRRCRSTRSCSAGCAIRADERGAALARTHAQDRVLAGVSRGNAARDRARRDSLHPDREGAVRGGFLRLAWPQLLLDRVCT